MGIRGLETYLLQKHPQACPRVKLEDLLDEYRAETGRSEAVAVIDTTLLIRQCISDLDVVCGGQFEEFKTNLLNYCQRLTDLGISLVFFMDGSIDVGKMRCWMERKDQTLRRVEEIYEAIAQGARTSPIPVGSCVLPAGLYECAILTLKQANFPVFCSPGDGDREMVRYALEHDCFCIMSRDTDFAMMPGAHFYVTIYHEHFRVEDMSTFLFDRLAIARTLGLRPEHLPLLATLLHNDFVDGRYLSPLYRKLVKRRAPPALEDYYKLEFIIPHLVTFINDELNDRQLERTGKDAVSVIISKTFDGQIPRFLRGLAQDLGLKDQFEMRDRLRDQLIASLVRYNYLSPPAPPPELGADVDTEVLELARTRHRLVDFLTSSIMTLLEQRIMFMGPALEDPNVAASCTTEHALRPFRRRVYGLLQVRGAVAEWVTAAGAPSNGQAYQPCIVEPIFPDPAVHPHPGLLALWRSDEADKDLLASKWRLFAWALSAHRPSTACVDELSVNLRALPRHLVVPASIVYLLYHSGALSRCGRPADELVRLLMKTSLSARHIPETELRALNVERFDKTEVHVAAIFMRAFTYVSIMNDVLGAPVALDQLHPSLYFNGKLFHQNFMDDSFDEAPTSFLDEDAENVFVTIVTSA